MLNSFTQMFKRGPKPEKLERIPFEQVMSYGALKRDIGLLPGKISVVQGDDREEDPLGRLKYLASHVVSQINRKEKEELMNDYDTKATELFEQVVDVPRVSEAGVDNPSYNPAERYKAAKQFVETFPFMHEPTRQKVMTMLLAQRQNIN